MSAKEVAERLLEFPAGMEVLLKVGEDWLDVCDVDYTGQHRHAVTLFTCPRAKSPNGSEDEA